jgi:uncharacterized protein (DUF1800 family)
MRITWTPSPAAQQYKMFRADDLSQPWIEDTIVSGFDWLTPLGSGMGFRRLQAIPMSDNDLLTATVLNRLAYGPTPDELERVRAIGPDAYINEQLAPETINENLDIDVEVPIGGWRYITLTGTASSSILYVYLTSPGELYVDDLVLVSGTNAGAGANLIRNGDFEAPLTTNEWTISTNLTSSSISSAPVHSGSGSLHLVASSAGSSQGTAIWQTISPALITGQTYTLSYWYYAPSNDASDLVIRLSGSGINSVPDSTLPLMTKLKNGFAGLSDLRAWHILHAVRAQRQLLEVLDQFLENHFVTEQSKSIDYFDRFYDDGTVMDRLATQLEFKEHQRWRQALLNPDCTFYDLLKISAESQAMIIYLDTVDSRGDGSNIANENFARELLELFTCGVDNGYDQNDIVQMSKVWTGWRLRLVDPTNEFNPFAPQSTTLKSGATNVNDIPSLEGVWAFNYRFDRHNLTAKTIFPGKTVPARFGQPWAGLSYQLSLLARSGTNSIQDGYDTVAHLADRPFTQEFISVKLCRLFIHDDFVHGVYDYTDPNLSAEGQLVHQCMLAWGNSIPKKGKVRDVLRVIFNSDLFRSHGGSLQKVKTPLEFTVSTIRALRSDNANGTFTADTDGLAIISPLDRMGRMRLFDRAEPDGYPEAAAPWISAGTLAERLRFVQTFCLAPSQRGGLTDAGNSSCSPVALLQKKVPNTSWSDASAVADYFLGILFPGEGSANLDLYRTSATRFLNTADDGVASSPFSALTVSTTAGSAYDTRVRGVVGMLLTFQRFQEQ